MDPEHAFCTENGVDDRATGSFFEAPVHIRHAVMAEGPLSGRNPSAVLLSRLRRAEASGPDPISVFIMENQLDQAAEQKLREQSGPVQQAVLDEGPLAGARNPSAVLAGRIRRILQNSPATGAKRPRQSSAPGDEIDSFIAENSIDEKAAGALREASPHIQQLVMQEGNITGRNPSAILLSRIRRAA
jgi:hypothetical protein